MQTLLTGKPYIPAAQTDITKRWRAMGWKPKTRLTPKLGAGYPIFYERRTTLL